MIYNNNNITELDLKKYNRHFVFGCSFTNYYWPTWADILTKEMPGVNYINTAKPGAGNSYILAKLSQAMRYYNIGEGDLVSIMWTTFYRQDRFQEGEWQTPGNIYTQNTVPIETVEKYYDDTFGFAQRDFALIDTAVNMMAGQEYDSLMMWGVSPDKQDYYGLSQHWDKETDCSSLKSLYKNLENSILPDLLTVGCNEHWAETFSFTQPDGSSQVDYHPKTKTYYNYLKTIGINLSEETGAWADECDAHTTSVESSEDLDYLHKWFNFINL